MNIITLTKENLESEHICCAISNNKDIQVSSKKDWLADRIDEGLMFLKGDMRGKCFVEYIPAEFAWVPINADGYMHINCFWISGQFKGQGHSNELLDACIKDSKAKGKHGLCVISSPKKMSFLSDPKHLAYKGFQIADSAEPYFTLMYLPFGSGAPVPHFKECAKHPQTDGDGFVLYYTHGCPFTAKYVPVVENTARENNIPFKSILIDSREMAQNAPAAWTNYALFYNGKFITNEIQNDKKFLMLAETLAKRSV